MCLPLFCWALPELPNSGRHRRRCANEKMSRLPSPFDLPSLPSGQKFLDAVRYGLIDQGKFLALRS
jgi:hypothetical protein